MSNNTVQNQKEQNLEQERPVKTQSSIEQQQGSEQELTEEELEKIAGGFRRPGRPIQLEN